MHDIAQAAADAAQVPSFDDVLARGQRRRNVRHGLTVGAAALAVAAILGVTQVVGDNGGRDIEPAPGPSEPTTVIDEEPSDTPAWIVDHREAQIGDAAVADGGATAVFWRVVNHRRWVLAVSDDGFSTRGLGQLAIPGDVTAAGDRFLLRDQARSRLWLVDPGGERVPVVVDGEEAPVGDGEVPVGMGTDLVAVDPAGATAHPVPAPEGTYDLGAYGGRLSGITTVIDSGGGRLATYHWSDDGGATWQSASFEAGELGIPQVVPTPAGAGHAIAMVSDGATIGPLAAVLTMPAPGDSFLVTAYDGELVSFAGVWAADGEIRFLADLWGDGSGPPRESGVYRWVDGRLDRIPSENPAVTDVQDRTLVDVVDTAGGPTLVVAVDNRLFRSTDGGGTWDELAAR